MRSVTPSIESAVSRLAPGFRALSIVVESAPVADPAVAEQALAEACLAVQQDDVPWAQAHLAAWDEAFSAFGAKAKRTPCSAQALRRTDIFSKKDCAKNHFRFFSAQPQARRLCLLTALTD